jgi:hypothetical protein
VVEALGREQAYASQYRVWRQSQEPLFRRVALAVPRGGLLAFYDLNLNTLQFEPGEWPAGWSAMRGRLLRRLRREPVELEEFYAGPAITECPRFGRGGEEEWLLSEPDVAYLRQKTFPELLDRYLADAGRLDYDAEVVETARPSEVIY